MAARRLAVVFAIAVALTALFAAARLARMDWNPSGFADVGELFVADRAAAPPGLKIWPDTGFDGQFYYRLALDPSDLGPVSHGLRLDSRVRLNRIGYPALAWAAAAGGRERVVPWTLIALNVLGVGALALLGGIAARDAGRDPRWGLLIAGFGGFVIGVGRDLTEITSASLMLGALLLARRRRFVFAGLLLGAAAVTRESALLIVAGLALAWLVEAVRGRIDVGAAAAWALPIAAVGAWQAVAAANVGGLPLTANGGNLTAPFGALAPDALRWLNGTGRPGLAVPELLVLAVLTVLTALSLGRSLVPLGEKIAWIVAVVAAVSLSHDVYVGPADFRTWGEAYVLGTLVLLADPQRQLRLPGVLVGGWWLAACAFHLVVLS